LHPVDILFAACLMLGGIYTLFTLVMGGISEMGGHGHHFGDAGHVDSLADGGFHHGGEIAHADSGFDASQGHLAHDAGTPDVDGDTGHADTATGDDGHFSLLHYLNPVAMAGFCLGFGGVGTLCRLAFKLPVLGSLLWAMAGGMGLWLATYLLVARFIAGSQASSHYRQEEMVGLRGQVTAPIEGSRPGMVACTIAGRRQLVRAITDDPDPIPAGSVVRIRRIQDNTAKVIRIE